MDGDGEGKAGNNDDLYGVLGLHKECTSAELRSAYKKLAMRWHPDRYSTSGNNKYVEEAKKKFQDIQEAYSVLSDSSKRLLYDVGAYDEDDDDNNNGMGEFLDEMIAMMNQTNPTQQQQQQRQQQECGGPKNETFEELQELFDEMFNADIMMKPACASSSSSTLLSSSETPTPLYSCQSSSSSIASTSNLKNSKRNSTHMNYGDKDDYWRGKTSSDINFSSFFFGTGATAAQATRSSSQKKGRTETCRKNHHR